MRFRILIPAFLATFVTISSAWAGNYSIDVDHTAISFKVKHLFSKVQGTFNEFEGSFVYDPAKPEEWKANVVIQAASIDTRNKHRDNHLRNADFFDVEKYPTITFESTSAEKIDDQKAVLRGVLSMHGVEKEVALDVDIHGVGQDPWGNTLVGMTATTKLDRTEYGLNWNQALETGGVLVGNEIEITIEIEGILQQ